MLFQVYIKLVLWKVCHNGEAPGCLGPWVMIAFIFSTIALGCIRFIKLAGQYIQRDRSGKDSMVRGTWKWKTRLIEVSVLWLSDILQPPSFELFAII